MIGEIEGIKIYVNNETYTKYKKTLEDEIDELQQQNQKYKEVIDKAIEYINSSDISIDIRKTDGSLDYVSTDELLDILKEVE